MVVNLSDASEVDPFNNFRPNVSSWTPPDGRFSSLDRYIDKRRRVINNIDFTKKSKFNNLSSEERKASISLQKRDDIVMKPADKGDVVVVCYANFI